MDTASYRSYLVRLWREPGTAGDTWQGEVEHIQSGAIIAISSLEDACNFIQRAAAVGEDRGGSGTPPQPPTSRSRNH